MESVNVRMRKEELKMRLEDEGKVNKFFKTNEPIFVAACEKVGLKVTKRQASKWLMQKGKAFNEGRN